MSNVFKRLRLRQVDEKLKPWRDMLPGEPKTGWIRAIRDALGMSSSQLAKRMGISQQAVTNLEQREAQGSATLSALRAAAAALDLEMPQLTDFRVRIPPAVAPQRWSRP